MCGKSGNRGHRFFVEPLESRAYFSASLSGATFVHLSQADTVISQSLRARSNNAKAYVFDLSSTADVNLSLTGTGATFELISDRNRNGRYDSGELVVVCKGSASATELHRALGAGTYYLRVTRNDRGVGNSGTKALAYQIHATAIDTLNALIADHAGNTPAAARILPLRSGRGNCTVSDSVGTSDALDYYRLDITSNTRLNIRLNGLVWDADVELIKDGKTLATTAGHYLTEKSITGTVGVGTCYIRVRPSEGKDTSYSLRVVGEAGRSDDVHLDSTKTVRSKIFSSKSLT
jgi:hypothetical protein